VPIAYRSRLPLPALAGLLALLGAPAASQAHFVLVSPAANYQQSGLGDPQKAPPCGDDGSAVATGEITNVQPGETITITIDETIFHPGHYRIALALDDGVFPEEPPVTAGATACGSAPIDPAPAFPVLADGVWEHTDPFTEPQSIDVTIPADVSCTSCTLQVIQFMSNHGLNNPGGCYYHHCASIGVDGDPPATTTSPGDESGGSSGGGPEVTTGVADDTAGPGETGAGGSSEGNADTSMDIDSNTDGNTTAETPADGDGGCGCAAPGHRGGVGALVGLVALLGLRRRRSSRA
jgi:MYXO-CTERM domain-containing protein